MRRVGKLAGDFFNQIRGYAGDLLSPCGSVGFYLVIAARRVAVFQTTIEAVVRQHQIVNDDHPFLATVGERQGFARHAARQHRLLLHAAKMRVLITAKVGEGDICDAIVRNQQGEGQLAFMACRPGLQVPFAFFSPAEADGTVWHYQVPGNIKGDRFPFRIIGFTQPVDKV